MATTDTSCSIAPYFKVNAGQLEAFRSLCERFVKKTSDEAGCLYYDFTLDGDQVDCREAYGNADGVLAHLKNVGTLLDEALKVASITRLEVHGPDAELQKLRKPLAGLKPQFFTLEYGFRR